MTWAACGTGGRGWPAAGERTIGDLVIRSRTQLTLGALPFLALAAVTMIDLLTGHRVILLALLSLGPAFAAVAGGPRRVVLVSATALALCAFLAGYQDLFTSGDDILAFMTVLGVSTAGVVASILRQQQENELADVRMVAEVAQQVLLRPIPAGPAGLQIAVRYISATSRATIGGDLYEVMAAGDGLRLIVGDVQGKGLAAVKTAATVLGAFREAAPHTPDLAMIAARIEAALARELSDEQFVTAVLAKVSTDGSKIELLNRGHPPPLLLHSTGTRFVEPAAECLPLGLGQFEPGPGELTALDFGPDERILFYTDGISEARDRSGEFFPLADFGAGYHGLGPDELLDRLSEAVIRHSGHPLDDDAALLLVSH